MLFAVNLFPSQFTQTWIAISIVLNLLILQAADLHQTSNKLFTINYDQHKNTGCGFLTRSIFPHIPPYLNFHYSTPTIPNTAWIHHPEICTACNSFLKTLTYKTRDTRKAFKFINNVISARGLNLVTRGNNWFGIFIGYQRSVLKSIGTVNKPWQKYPFIPGAMLLENKCSLSTLTTQAQITLQELNASNQISFQGYNLPEELSLFNSEWERQNKINHAENIWILKPAIGAGSYVVKVISNPNTLNKVQNKRYLIQKYSTRPFLAAGRRVELRAFVVVTSVFPTMRAYLTSASDQNIVRYGMHNFTLDPNTFKDRCMHTRFEPCLASHEKLAYLLKLEHFYTMYLKNDTSRAIIQQRMEETIRATLLTLQSDARWQTTRWTIESSQIFNSYCYNEYHKFAFDFLLDEELNVMINEVNILPAQYEHDMQNVVAELNLAGFHLPPTPNNNSIQMQLLSTCLNVETTKIEELIFNFNEKIYTLELTDKDIKKHTFIREKFNEELYLTLATWNSMVEAIVNSPTPADIRFLLLTFDDTSRSQPSFRRILPIEQQPDQLQSVDFDKTKQRLDYYAKFLLISNNDDSKRNRVFYYYVLYEAWMWKYQTKNAAIAQLTKFAATKYHLM